MSLALYTNVALTAYIADKGSPDAKYQLLVEIRIHTVKIILVMSFFFNI